MARKDMWGNELPADGSNPVNPWAPKAAGNGLTGGISLDAATPTPKTAGNGTTGGVSTDEWGGGATPKAAGESAEAKSYILDPDKYNSMIRPGGSFKTNAPTIAQFMEATGSDFQTAADTISGVVGRAPDMRDWDSIMGSGDPLSAASQATGQFFAPGNHSAVVSDELKSLGYSPFGSGNYGTKPLAQAGNFAVTDNGTTPSGQKKLALSLVDSEGNLGVPVSWDNGSIEKVAKQYGIPLSSLGNLADQLDAQGVSYMPGQMGQGTNIGADLRGLAGRAGSGPPPPMGTPQTGQNPYLMLADRVDQTGAPAGQTAAPAPQNQDVLGRLMGGLLNPQTPQAYKPTQPSGMAQSVQQGQDPSNTSRSKMTDYMGLSGGNSGNSGNPLVQLLMSLTGQ